MKLTRERKIYAGLLAVAAVALLADQLFFADGPAAAQAGSAALVVAPAPVDHPAAMPAATPGIDLGQVDLQLTELNTANSLAHRLAAVARQHDLRVNEVGNAFEPSAQWVAAPPPPQAPVELPSTRGRDFEARHKLTAVVVNARGGLAMVDGAPLKVGEQVEGFVLVSVMPTSAMFRSGDVEAVLELKLPGDSVPRSAP